VSLDAEANDLKALIAAAAKAPAYDLDDIKALPSPPARYVEVYLTRRFGGPLRGDSRDAELRRLSTRVVADTVTNGRLIEDRIADAFRHSTLSVAGTATHIEFESGAAFGWDDGYWTALTDWTLAL
jgi:hypothetical protein